MHHNAQIILISCGIFEKHVTGPIIKDIEREFQHPVFLKECNEDLHRFYNPGRRQYDANSLLSMVTDLSPPEALKVIGLFRIDLFIPILTYIFGQAESSGKAGVASMYRLRNELYGLEKNNELLTERFSKVIMHELGHTFGLIHCNYPVCIMRSSTYAEDIDQKEKRFCHQCKAALKRDQ